MGGVVATVHTARGLADAGVQTRLLVPDGGGSLEDALARYGLNHVPGLRVERPCAIRGRIGPVRIAWPRRYYRAVSHRLQRLHREHALDVVVVRALKLAAWLVRDRAPGGAGRACPVPLVYEAHNWYGDLERKWNDPSDLVETRKLESEQRLRDVEAELLPRVDGLVTVTGPMLSLMRERVAPGTPLAVAPMGVVPPERLPEPCREPTLVYVGQLHPHKGLGVALEALSKLPATVHLRVIGGPAHLDRWQERARALGIAERVAFTGPVPHAQVAAQLARARIALLPLRDCFYNRYLTSPVKLGEYAAAGLPVVASRLPVLEERGRDDEHFLLVQPDDPHELAAAVRRILEDPALEGRLRRGIRGKLPEWSWRRRCEILRALCVRVIEHDRSES